MRRVTLPGSNSAKSGKIKKLPVSQMSTPKGAHQRFANLTYVAVTRAVAEKAELP